MSDALTHRGPDDQGMIVKTGGRRPETGRESSVSGLQPPVSPYEVGLAHRRLSIIDLSAAGHQPMCNEDESIWIVFNGEFYNFKEYREALEVMGHEFKSHTDTEVIIHLYEEYGIDETLKRMNGMFAFALWDSRKEELHLVRDRMGQKPLYFSALPKNKENSLRSSEWGFRTKNKVEDPANSGEQRTKNSPLRGLVFASEIKSLLASGLMDDRSPDLQALDHFWTYGYAMEGRSQYEGIRQILPGHRAVWSRKGFHTQPYWNVSFQALDSGQRSLDDWVDELEALLVDAIRLRLVSDVPLGCFLSGGIDSSIMAALCSKKLGIDLETYTIGFEQASHDESAHAVAVANHLGLPNRTLIVGQDLEASFRDIARQYDEPFGDLSSIPTWHLCRLARKYTVVALTGDGGDELFGGYHHYREGLSIWGKSSEGSKVKGAASVKAALVRQYYRWRGPAMGNALRGRRINGHLGKILYTPEFLRSVDRMKTVRARAYGAESRGASRHVLDVLQNMDVHTYMVDDVLTKVDRMSMAHSLECRSPFMDHRIVEFASRLPLDCRIDENGKGKKILRALLARYIPVELFDRPKQGFTPPWEEWISGSTAADLRRRWRALDDPLTRRDAADRLFPDEGNNPVLSWNGYSYLTWMQNQGDYVTVDRGLLTIDH